MTPDLLVANMLICLDQDVSNPNPDRRSKNWDKLPVWHRGTKFLVRESGPVDRRTHRLEPMVRWGANYTLGPWDKDAYARVIANASPTEPTMASIIRAADANDWGHRHILKVLLSEGKITLDDVRRALTLEPDADV